MRKREPNPPRTSEVGPGTSYLFAVSSTEASVEVKVLVRANPPPPFIL